MSKLGTISQHSGAISTSAYRVLFLLRAFLHHECLSLSDINNLIEADVLFGEALLQETFHKYLMTLRAMGCEIHLHRGKSPPEYTLRVSPIPLRLSPEMHHAAQHLADALAYHPQRSLTESWASFLQVLARLDRNPVYSKGPLGDSREVSPLSGELLEAPAVLQQLVQACDAQQRILLQGMADPVAEPQLLEPVQLHYPAAPMPKQPMFPEAVVLEAFDPSTHAVCRIPITPAMRVTVLPQKNRVAPPKITVVFRLHGRLSVSYRPYPHEQVKRLNPQCLEVRHQTTSPELLLKRLLRYGDACEVCSPTSMQQQLIAHVQQVLQRL